MEENPASESYIQLQTFEKGENNDREVSPFHEQTEYSLDQPAERIDFSGDDNPESTDKLNSSTQAEASPHYRPVTRRVQDSPTVPLIPLGSASSRSRSKAWKKRCTCDCSGWDKCILKILACCCCFFCIFLMLLLFFVGLLYNNRTLSTSTNITLIQNPSIPLIGTVDDVSGIDSVRFNETKETDVIPVDFYALNLSSCLRDDLIANIPLNNTIWLNFDSLSVRSKAVTEWYLLSGSKINVHIDVVTTSDSVSVDCYLTLIVFDSYYQFVDFIMQEMWLNNHSAVCISEKRSIQNFNFTRNSYYYFGVHTNIPGEIETVSLRFVGNYRQYNLSNAVIGCSLSASQTSCDIKASDLNLQSACFVCSIPANKANLGLREANIDFYIATISDTNRFVYFFLPLIITVALVPYCVIILLSCVVCCAAVCED